MRHLKANLSSRVRRDSLHGRPHLVAPVTLIVPGVLNGSKGPLYYPSEEVEASASSWDHMPLVRYHPFDKDGPTSARLPSILNKQGIGVLLNTRFQNGKLVGEAWFDIAKTREVDNRLLGRIESGNSVEVSTGLLTDDEPATNGASFNGRSYDFVARNYRPDHLAILPDQVGACSIKDGCGILVNRKGRTLKPLGNIFIQKSKMFSLNIGANTMAKKLTVKQRQVVINELIENGCCWEEEDRETLESLTDNSLTRLYAAAEDNAKRDAVYELVQNAAPEDKKDELPAFIKEKLDGKEEEEEEEEEVKNEELTEEEKKRLAEEEAEEEEEVANGCKPKNDNKMTGNKRPKMKKKETVENKEEKKIMTTKEWLESAPIEVRSVVQNAMAMEAAEKTRLVERITANLDKDAKAKVINRLKDSTLDTLRDLSLLASPNNREENQGPADYFGQVGGVINRTSFDKDDFLPLPTMNWGQKAES